MYMGEYPIDYSSAVDISSVELYWDVPGDPLYQQFVYAFMQGITHERGAASGSSPRPTASRAFRRRSRFSCVAWKERRGACTPSSSNRPGAKSITNCTWKT